MEVESITSQQEPEISHRRQKEEEEEEEEHEESVLMIEEEEEEEQDRETGVTDEEDNNRNNNIVEEGAASETTQESENEERLRHRPSVVIPKPRIEPLLPSFFASEPLHHHSLHLHSTAATNRKRRLSEERREGSTSAFKAVVRMKPQGEEEREGEEEESSSSSSSSSSARWYHSASAKRERRSDDSNGTKVSLPPLSALSECASLLPPISSSSSSLPFIPSTPSSSAPNRPQLPPLARPQPQPKFPEVHPSASAARSVSFPPAEDQQHHVRRPPPSLAPPQRDDFQRMYPYLDKDQLQVLVSSFMQTSRVQQSKDGSPMTVAPHEVAAAQLLSAWQKHTSKLSSSCSSPSSSASFTYGEGVQLEERRKMGYAHHRERPGSCSSEDISSFRSFLQQQLIALKRQQEHQNAGRASSTTTNDPNLQHIHNLLSMRLSSSAVSSSCLTSSCSMPSTSVSSPLPPSPASGVASSSSASSSLPMELLRERASSIQSPENLQEYLATFTENMREISEIKHNKLRNKLLKQQKGAESNKKIKKGRRKPRRLKGPQVFLLEEVFKLNPVPNSKTKQKLAEQLGVSNRRIQVWFQNRRAKVRKISKNMTTPSPSSSSSTTTTSSTSTATTSSFSDAYVSSSSSPSSSRPASPTRTTTTSTLPMSLSSLLSGAPLPLSPSASSSVLKA
ncbi:Homeodomain containing protein mix [Balamuthia mandrillaris]